MWCPGQRGADAPLRSPKLLLQFHKLLMLPLQLLEASTQPPALPALDTSLFLRPPAGRPSAAAVEVHAASELHRAAWHRAEKAD